MNAGTNPEASFLALTEPLLQQRTSFTRSTMMGLPCLRVHGAVFASYDHRTGDLLVKFPATRVEELVANGIARHFAPAGRRFRQWAAIPPDKERSWKSLLDESLAFVSDPGETTPEPRS